MAEPDAAFTPSWPELLHNVRRASLQFVLAEIASIQAFLMRTRTYLEYRDFEDAHRLIAECAKGIAAASQALSKLDASAETNAARQQLTAVALEVESTACEINAYLSGDGSSGNHS